MRVAIVGAGITGLALTHHLREQDIECRTFEAATEPGGVINSQRIDGHVVEVGPQRMRRTPGVDELIETVGLEDAAIEADEAPLYVYADGKLREAPLDAPTLLRTDLLSWRGKLRFLAEPATRSGRPEETAAELFTRKFGREAYERFIGPLYGGIYGSDPAEMPAAYALEGLLEREQEAGSLLQAFKRRVGQGQTAPPLSFTEGNQQLPNALADEYSDVVELETPVTAIEETDGKSGYTVTADGDRIDTDHVVLTTPADTTGRLLDGIAENAGGLEEMTYNPLAMVHLVADCEREGFGYQVAFDENLQTLGSSWNASMFDREGLYTVFLGGMHEPGIIEKSDEEIGDTARDEFEQVMDTDATVLHVETRERWFPAYDHSWDVLEEFDTPPGIHLATNYTARMGIPSRVREARQLASELAQQGPQTTV